MEGRTNPEAAVVRGYYLAVRSAVADDGLPPLAVSGVVLHQRLVAVGRSLERGASKGGRHSRCTG
jgi:hypothetical protein